MAKKVVSVALHKKKRKPVTKRRHLKSALKKFFNYMKSDTFMYAPLLLPLHSYRPLPFDEKKTGVVVQNDANYLKSDCYMYAPLRNDTAKGKKSTSVCDELEATREETGAMKDAGQSCCYNGVVLEKEKETIIMQIVHQNCRPPSL